MINLTLLNNTADLVGSGVPVVLNGCVNPNGVIGWCNEHLVRELSSATHYVRVLEVCFVLFALAVAFREWTIYKKQKESK